MSAVPEVRRTVPTSRPYRLWDVTHTTWADRPAGTLVAHDGWGVSYSMLDRVFSSRSVVDAADFNEDELKVTLRLYRTDDGGGSFTYHELHNTKYDTQAEAQRAAFEAGALAVMAYEEVPS